MDEIPPPIVLGYKTPLITENDKLQQHVGALVSICGKVGTSKKSTILGVEVHALFDQKGKKAYASGILIEANQPIGIPKQGRFNGGFSDDRLNQLEGTPNDLIGVPSGRKRYILYENLSGRIARVTVIKKPEIGENKKATDTGGSAAINGN